MQTFGEDFTSSIILNLLPGITLPYDMYQIDARYITECGGQMDMHHMSMMSSGIDLKAKFGRDVREISFLVRNQGGNVEIHYRYDLRLDRLILLNLAHQLLK